MSDPLPKELNDLIDKIIGRTNQTQASRLQDEYENQSLTNEYSYSESSFNNSSKLKNMEVNTLKINNLYPLNDETELQEADESDNAEFQE
ncbi:15536_t:CDS:2 [Gigaspora rosea]|nr:15536_t:CDS:2 [Gigaspora rosea]